MSQHAGTGRDVKRRPETKSFILTSEFWVTVARQQPCSSRYALDDIGAENSAWKYGTWIAIRVHHQSGYRQGWESACLRTRSHCSCTRTRVSANDYDDDPDGPPRELLRCRLPETTIPVAPRRAGATKPGQR